MDGWSNVMQYKWRYCRCNSAVKAIKIGWLFHPWLETAHMRFLMPVVLLIIEQSEAYPVNRLRYTLPQRLAVLATRWQHGCGCRFCNMR